MAMLSFSNRNHLQICLLYFTSFHRSNALKSADLAIRHREPPVKSIAPLISMLASLYIATSTWLCSAFNSTCLLDLRVRELASTMSPSLHYISDCHYLEPFATCSNLRRYGSRYHTQPPLSACISSCPSILRLYHLTPHLNHRATLKASRSRPTCCVPSLPFACLKPGCWVETRGCSPFFSKLSFQRRSTSSGLTSNMHMEFDITMEKKEKELIYTILLSEDYFIYTWCR